jgi:hypothetical protein
VTVVAAEQALLSELATLFPDVAIEGENLPVTVPAGQKWIQVFDLGARPRVGTLGTHGEDRLNGILQLTIHYTLSTGKDAYNDDYESVREHFPAGSAFTYSGQTVQITGVDRSTGRKNQKDFVGDISINWLAYIPR